MYETRISAYLVESQIPSAEVQSFKEDAEEPLVAALERVSVVMQRGAVKHVRFTLLGRRRESPSFVRSLIVTF